MKVKFQLEDVYRAFNELRPLIRLCHEEVGHFRELDPEPDWQAYAAAQDAGILKLFVARDPEGQIAGFCVFIVRTSGHHRYTLAALQDVLYVIPTMRGRFTLRFIKWIDEQLYRMGVGFVLRQMRRDQGPIYKRLGYEKVEEVWARRIGLGARPFDSKPGLAIAARHMGESI